MKYIKGKGNFVVLEMFPSSGLDMANFTLSNTRDAGFGLTLGQCCPTRGLPTDFMRPASAD